MSVNASECSRHEIWSFRKKSEFLSYFFPSKDSNQGTEGILRDIENSELGMTDCR